MRFEFDKETKNTVRFQEVSNDEVLDPIAIGPLYIQKSALKQLGYHEGAVLEVSLEVR